LSTLKNFKTLSEILDQHKEKYNNLKIENNFDIIKREAKLNAIESYYSFGQLNDAELREKLIEVAHSIKINHDSVEKGTEYQYIFGCHLEYWYELTDELKKVYIVGRKNAK
jgi:hypothetical protein